MSNCSSGTWREKPARKKDSLDVFSREPPGGGGGGGGNGGRPFQAGAMAHPACRTRTRCSRLDQRRGLDRLGHAVEHLKFDGPRVQTQDIGFAKRVGDAADVVGGDGGMKQLVVLQKKIGLGFEIGVGLGLVGKDGERPMVLGGDDGFVIPIGAL